MGKPYIDENGKSLYAVRAARRFFHNRTVVKEGDYMALDEAEYIYRTKSGDVVDDDHDERQAKAKVEVLIRIDSETRRAELAEKKAKAARKAKKAATQIVEVGEAVQDFQQAPAPPALSDEEIRAQFAELSQGFGVE